MIPDFDSERVQLDASTSHIRVYYINLPVIKHKDEWKIIKKHKFIILRPLRRALPRHHCKKLVQVSG